MERDDRFFQYPLFLVRDMLFDRNTTLNKIIRFGVYNYSLTINYDINEVARQLMYCYYREKSSLTHDLHTIMKRYVDEDKILLDEDYFGFSGAEFNPVDQIEEVLKLFADDVDFETSANENMRVRQSLKYFDINTPNVDNLIKDAIRIKNMIPEREPLLSINKKMLFDFRDNEKDEWDVLQLLAFMSVKSILGKKLFCKTNYELIINRMFGYASQLNSFENKPFLDVYKNKYSHRYWADKLFVELELNWNVLKYSNHARGFYVCIGNTKSKDLRMSLIDYAEKKKKKNRITELTNLKKEVSKEYYNLTSK